MHSHINQDKLKEHKQRAAFHAAGYAAAIHLNTKIKHLPHVFFNIFFEEIGYINATDGITYKATQDDYIAQVGGGRSIELLPDSVESLARELTKNNSAMVRLLEDYKVVFESDIINLLIGPLAEAKHIADIDGELFNYRLINLNALKNYSDNSDLALINKYLQSFFADKQKNEKLDELFTEAFGFVNNDANWAVITQLANYILGVHCEHVICGKDIGLMVDQSIANFKDRRAKARHRDNEWFKVTADHIKTNYATSMKSLNRPSQAALDSMNHAEKDELILGLFDWLEGLEIRF
ncbi:MAG: hypothetical protein ACXV8O_20545 [Methylobacter sp.]